MYTEFSNLVGTDLGLHALKNDALDRELVRLAPPLLSGSAARVGDHGDETAVTYVFTICVCAAADDLPDAAGVPQTHLTTCYHCMEPDLLHAASETGPTTHVSVCAQCITPGQVA